jgi:hypothetical protein
VNMELAAIIVARYFVFIETVELNPRGRAFFPELVTALVNRYGFVKFPQKPEDYDETKGVVFQGGRMGNVTVAQVQVFNHATVVDTASSTDDSERFLNEAFTWLSKDFGIAYRPDMVRRKTYVSQISFYSDIVLPKLHPAISRLADRLSARVPEYFMQPLKYQPSGLIVGYDPQTVKTGPSAFTIEPRADSLFEEHKYFSTAPLPTNEHIALLEQFEKDVNDFNARVAFRS